jgi:hypothetical protein
MKRTSPSLQIFKPAMAATLAIVIMCGLSVRPAQAGYIVTLQQVGSDVVATGSGPIDLTGLTQVGNGSGGDSLVIPGTGWIETGPASGNGFDLYRLVTGPSSFGPGSGAFASSGSGDFVGILSNSGSLVVPAGYVSGTALSDSSTYNSATFSSLGVNTGTFEWTWGTGANQNFTLKVGAAGVPDSGSTFTLLLLSFAALFCASRFRSQQSA